MSSLSIKYDLRALKQPAEMFRKLAEKGEDTLPLAEEISSYLHFSTTRRFETETDPDGNKWAKTARGGAILQDRGHLLGSIKPAPAKDLARIFTNKIYAAIHNWGGIIKPKNKKALAFSVGGKFVLAKQVKIPKRQFMGINAQDREAIREIAMDYFTRVLRAAA